MIPGIDVSHWQGEIDWAKVKAAGVKFAFLKASEFPDKKLTMFIDDKFEINRKGAEENGIYWGAYHFFRTHIDPVNQAEEFCKLVGTADSLPLVMDLEVAGCKGTKLVRKVKSFVETVASITGRKPIIYTSGGFWRPYLTYEKITDVDWALEYPFWMARYTSQWPGSVYPWCAWDFWQYSDKGRIPGIKGSVDLNWFIGTLEELQTRFLPTKTGKQETVQAEAVLQETTKSTHDHPVLLKNDYQEDNIVGNSAPDGMHIPAKNNGAGAGLEKNDKQGKSGKKDPSFLTFLHNKFKQNKKKTIDPVQSQEWIEDVIYRDKE